MITRMTAIVIKHIYIAPFNNRHRSRD